MNVSVIFISILINDKMSNQFKGGESNPDKIQVTGYLVSNKEGNLVIKESRVNMHEREAVVEPKIVVMRVGKIFRRADVYFKVEKRCGSIKCLGHALPTDPNYRNNLK